MSNVHHHHKGAQAEAAELLKAISSAETVIVSTIERECEALRARRMLAARALHTRLCDAAKLYLDATRAARASIEAIEEILPGSLALLEDSRSAFSTLLKVELAVLATHRASAGAESEPDFAGQKLGGPPGLPSVESRPAARPAPRPIAPRLRIDPAVIPGIRSTRSGAR